MGPTSPPELVRRYAESVLPDPAPSGAWVRLGQVGEMVLKPGRRPLRFEAIEEFALERVEFAWNARFPIRGRLSLRVTDEYRPPRGLLEVRLFGLPIQRNSSAELARGEVFRYLAELSWAPHAILANRQLEWREIDERTAEVSTAVAGERIAVRLLFRGNEIVQAAARRPRLESGGELADWIGEFREYTSFGAVRVPARGEVRWELPDGPFTYWRGTITSVETLDERR